MGLWGKFIIGFNLLLHKLCIRKATQIPEQNFLLETCAGLIFSSFLFFICYYMVRGLQKPKIDEESKESEESSCSIRTTACSSTILCTEENVIKSDQASPKENEKLRVSNPVLDFSQDPEWRNTDPLPEEHKMKKRTPSVCILDVTPSEYVKLDRKRQQERLKAIRQLSLTSLFDNLMNKDFPREELRRQIEEITEETIMQAAGIADCSHLIDSTKVTDSFVDLITSVVQNDSLGEKSAYHKEIVDVLHALGNMGRTSNVAMHQKLQAMDSSSSFSSSTSTKITDNTLNDSHTEIDKIDEKPSTSTI